MDEDGNPLVNRVVNWSSDKNSIATVSEDGVVTGVSEGTAFITAKSGNVESTALVEVIESRVGGINVQPVGQNPAQQGPQGEKGEKGDKGDTGDTGPAGPQGEKGDKGADGSPGEKGADGAPGDKGADGAPGVKGEKGDTGPAGPAGTATAGDSVWTTKGKNITYTKGAVGVGTDNPVGLHPDLGFVVEGFSTLTDSKAQYNSHFPWVSNDAYVTGKTIFIRGGAPTGWNPILTANSVNSSVGIGTTVPGAKLHIEHLNQDANGNSLIIGPTNASNLRLGYNKEYSWVQSHGSKPLAINPVGNNVGVGTTAPVDKLHVVGNIRITSGSFIDDGLKLNVPDYVFENDYSLMSLDDLRAYVAENKHLPNVPNRLDVSENGLNVSEFQMNLLEKTEELVLYTLEQDDALAAQSQRIDALEASLAGGTDLQGASFVGQMALPEVWSFGLTVLAIGAGAGWLFRSRREI